MSSSNQESADQQPGSRRAQIVNFPTSYATYVDRWAIVVGISKYQHESLNLRYADRDAEEVYKLLLSPIGGNFRSDHVVKLTNHEATTANITKALRSFLKRPCRDDLVIIYCACHGSPDFDRPENVYLLTYDTDPDDIAGTALPMREIDLSLRENLLSERVVIFADTCHSGAIGSGIGRRNIENHAAIVNRYLKEVSATRGGIALLTSAEANEVSFEDTRWGGGHGAFTYYLLRGMRGEADLNQNGFVTVGELFEYVRAKVQEATEYRQHPSIGTNPYDRNLPLAITFPTAQNPPNLGQLPENNHPPPGNPKKKNSPLNLPVPFIRFLNSKMIMIIFAAAVGAGGLFLKMIISPNPESMYFVVAGSSNNAIELASVYNEAKRLARGDFVISHDMSICDPKLGNGKYALVIGWKLPRPKAEQLVEQAKAVNFQRDSISLIPESKALFDVSKCKIIQSSNPQSPPKICTTSFQSENPTVVEFCREEIAGFQALIDGRFMEAKEHYCAAHDLYENAHSVYEICRKVLTRERMDAFAEADEFKQKEIQKEILQQIDNERWLVGIPTALRDKLKSRLSQLKKQTRGNSNS